MGGTYFQSNERQKFTIEPHGPDGQFALYIGRDNNHHGFRLCNLYDFDMNKKETIDSIVTALNNNLHLHSLTDDATDTRKSVAE